MIPIFVSITSTGQIWVSTSVDFNPAGTIVKQFRILDGAATQLICTLTGSGNSSASALACVLGTSGKSGKPEGNEIH